MQYIGVGAVARSLEDSDMSEHSYDGTGKIAVSQLTSLGKIWQIVEAYKAAAAKKDIAALELCWDMLVVSYDSLGCRELEKLARIKFGVSE